jgi:hypothetical protein
MATLRYNPEDFDPEGWRMLHKSEVLGEDDSYQFGSVQFLNDDEISWIDGYGNGLGFTYRTRLTKEQLKAKLKPRKNMATLKYKPIHNPANVDPSNLNSEHGYRFLNREEILEDSDDDLAPVVLLHELWKWDGTRWVSGVRGTNKYITYCTMLTPEQLRIKRNHG